MTTTMMSSNGPAASAARALTECLISPNEADSNGEAANVVDGLYSVGRAVRQLAKVQALEVLARYGGDELQARALTELLYIGGLGK